jgi:hypothetical protein
MIIAPAIAYGLVFFAVSSCSAAPSFIRSEPQSFIVKLKTGYSPKTHLSSIKGLAKAKTGKTTYFDSRVFHGYAVELADQAALHSLSLLDSVEYVEPDVVISVASLTEQTDAPWGLQAITRSVSASRLLLT